METKVDSFGGKEIIFHPMKNPVINKITNESASIATNSKAAENPRFKNIQIGAEAILHSLNDQKTTILLQKILMESSDEQVKLIANGLKGKYRQLILDKNGNFFCKDLFKICDQNERIEILKELSPALSVDCCNNFGTHPIQTLIDYSSTQGEYELILYSFNDNNNLLSAAINPNGAYVIQKIIGRIPEKFRSKFNYNFVFSLVFISKQQFGVISAKKFIECTKSETITQNIMNIIRTNFMSLAMDNYGNYLIQFLMEKWANLTEGNEIKNLIKNNFESLNKSKISTYICKKYLELEKKNNNNNNKSLNLNKLNEQPEENNQNVNFQKKNEGEGV